LFCRRIPATPQPVEFFNRLLRGEPIEGAKSSACREQPDESKTGFSFQPAEGLASLPGGAMICYISLAASDQ
jgi:hypothetical protein